MESITYFLIIAFFLVVGAAGIGVLLLAVGVIGLMVALIVAPSRWPTTKVRLMRWIFAGSAIVGVLTLKLIGGGVWYLGHRFDQARRVQQLYEEANCLELSPEEDYILVIFEFQDGTSKATLEHADRSQTYVHGMTECVIVDVYLLGATPGYWFWFDLTDAGSGHHFDRRAEFEEAIEELGLANEPVLLPPSDLCDTNECVPCRNSAEGLDTSPK